MIGLMDKLLTREGKDRALFSRNLTVDNSVFTVYFFQLRKEAIKWIKEDLKDSITKLNETRLDINDGIQIKRAIKILYYESLFAPGKTILVLREQFDNPIDKEKITEISKSYKSGKFITIIQNRRTHANDKMIKEIKALAKKGNDIFLYNFNPDTFFKSFSKPFLLDYETLNKKKVYSLERSFDKLKEHDRDIYHEGLVVAYVQKIGKGKLIHMLISQEGGTCKKDPSYYYKLVIDNFNIKLDQNNINKIRYVKKKKDDIKQRIKNLTDINRMGIDRSKHLYGEAAELEATLLQNITEIKELSNEEQFVKRIQKEYDSVLDSKMITSIRVINNYLVMTTRDIYCIYKNMICRIGKMRIDKDIEDGNPKNIYFINLTFNRFSTKYQGQHIRKQTPCLGGFGPELTAILATKDLYYMVEGLFRFLNVMTPGEFYIEPSEFEIYLPNGKLYRAQCIGANDRKEESEHPIITADLYAAKCKKEKIKVPKSVTKLYTMIDNNKFVPEIPKEK